MLKKGIFAIFKANIFSLIFNLATSFLLPKYLSVEAYAQTKSFQLYVTYVGLLHFGYADGMYLQYGGKNRKTIQKESIKSDIATMKVFQTIMMVLCLLISAFLRDPIWIAFSAAVLPLNMASYYKLLYQATGQFEKYGRVMNITTFITFAANMFLLIAISVNGSGLPYIAAYVGLDIIIWIYLELCLKKELNLSKIEGHFSFKIALTDIKDGILLMLGNLSSAFFTGMDRWFVKALIDTVSFAQYSFAVSIENFLNVAVTPVSVTLYNYFCNHIDSKSIKRVREYVVLFAVALPMCAFPAKFILEMFLVKYIDAVDVLFYLFAAQTYSVINKCIYINLYKATRQQKTYFMKLLVVLGVGFILNAGLFYFIRTKTAFAIGTLLSNIIWYVLSCLDFKAAYPSKKEIVFLLAETVCFILCGTLMNSVVGLLVYSCSSILLAIVLMRRQVRSLEKLLVDYIKPHHKGV